MSNTTERRWLSQQEAADHLGVTDRTIRNYISRGILRGYRVPRFPSGPHRPQRPRWVDAADPGVNDDPTYGLPWKPAQVHEAIDRLGDNRLTAAILVHEWLGRGGEPEELIAALQRQVAPNRAQIGELHEMVDGFTEQLEKRHARAERAERRRAEAESRDLARAVSINLDETTFDPRGFFVYLLWGDDTETPLYVGQSINVLGRLGQHMNSPDRRHKVRRVQVMRCRNRADMCKTEDRLIAHYQPPFNTRGILFDAPRKPHAIAGTA